MRVRIRGARRRWPPARWKRPLRPCRRREPVHNPRMTGEPQPGPDPSDAPILEFDPTHEAIVEAVHVTSVVGPDGVARQMPRRVVLCYFQDVIEKVVRDHRA